MNTETDALAMDEREAVIASNREALNPKRELKGLPESQKLKVEERFDEDACRGLSKIDSVGDLEITIGEHVLEAEQVGLQEGQEMEVELDTDSEEMNPIEEKTVKEEALKSGSSVKAHQACYQLPRESEGEFSVSDLVWGNQGQVASDEQLGREEKKVEEQDSVIETVCMKTETDMRAMDEGETVVASNKEALNSNSEVKGLPESQKLKVEERFDGGASHGLSEIGSIGVQEMTIGEHVLDAEHFGLQEGQEMEVELDTDSEQMKPIEEKSVKGEALKSESSVKAHQACDQLPPDNEGEFSVSDLVWGNQEKVAGAEDLRREEKKVEEQNSVIETACMNTETDTRAMDDGETVIASNKGAMNSESELKGLPESQKLKVEERFDENASRCLSQIDSIGEQEMTIGKHVLDAEQIGLQEGQEMEVELDTDSEQVKPIEEKSVKGEVFKSGSSVKAHQACYQLTSINEAGFSISDLVWGKVRGHPWWPGQIFDPSDASEKAIKCHKKDCFLVAYFGDRTFAWNEASLLKPFRSHFSQVEKQSNSEVFQNAVDCALEEVSRRVELGLACSCIPKDVYDEIKYQVVENAGIRQESSAREGVDTDARADLFQPDKLVDYVKALAQYPAGGANLLELVIAKSQLLAFYRLKGYCQLPEFKLEKSVALQTEDEEHAFAVYEDHGQISSGEEILQSQRSSYHKRKHNLKGSIYPRKKKSCLSDLMGDSWDMDDEIADDEKAPGKLISPSSGKKREGSDHFPDDASSTEGRKTISLAKVSSTTAFPKPSFKIGECIQRVASQMSGSSSILKCNNQKVDGINDAVGGDGSDFFHSEDADVKRMIVPTTHSSLDELLSQLHLAAEEPLKEYGFSNIIVSFFADFRNSVVIDQRGEVGGERRKLSHSFGSCPETFEFEDMNDTYWTDRVIQNGSEGQPPRKSRKRDDPFVPVVLDKPSGRSNRKRYSDSNYDISAQKPVGYVDANAPAELVMHFPVVDSVPSETNLNKMFKCFGPLKESETEVDRDTNRARVIFKRCSDAEAAYSSATKFNIFGAMLVNYQLNYTISVPFKSPPIATLHDDEDATLFLQY